MTFICAVLTMWCMGARTENKMYITIDGLTEQELRSFLKAGSSGISVLLSASNPTAIRGIKGNGKDKADSACYSVSGQRVSTPANVNGNANGNGLYIKNGNKIIL